MAADSVQFFEAEVVDRITIDLGRTRGELLIKVLEVERAMAKIDDLEKAIALRDEAIQSHETHALGLRTDIDRLREQLGSKPLPKRGTTK